MKFLYVFLKRHSLYLRVSYLISMMSMTQLV